MCIRDRLLLRHLYQLDHLYGLLLTFGLTLLIEGFFRSFYGVSGLQYQVPEQLTGARNLGFMILPNYRAWVVLASLIVCFGTWYVTVSYRHLTLPTSDLVYISVVAVSL